jgi:hypothetical protein
MTTKQQIMETYFSRYGKASSVAQLSGLLHKRFPNKKEDFKQEARDFITWKLREHREKERHSHYHNNGEGKISYSWNPKYMRGNIRDLIRWFSLDHQFNQIQMEFESAFQGLAYEHITYKQ